jgi:hypothetical protein
MTTENRICYLGTVDIDSQTKSFGLLQEDRRRHVYILGKSGMGKSTLLENLILQDIYSGQGVCFLDPLGDSADKILSHIPGFRQKDVIYFNPSDSQFPIGLNILEKNGEPDFLVASKVMSVLKRLWEGTWSARMEYILNNILLALLQTPNSTLLGVVKMLTDKGYRQYVVSNITNLVVKNFWEKEYPTFAGKYETEAISPILNKVGQFFSSDLIRNVLGQEKSTINFRQIMDEQKILIVNLSKGKIGEDASGLLGGIIVTNFQLAAMSRVDTPEKDRKDFFLYVDEFQNFVNQSFATILSEARKYRLCLTIANQFLGQLDSPEDEVIKKSIFGNIGSMICFRLGVEDSSLMATEFFPGQKDTEKVFLDLDSYQVAVQISVSNRPLQPFIATTLPSIYETVKSDSAKIIQLSQSVYGRNRLVVEQQIQKYFLPGQVVTPDGQIVVTKKKRRRKKTNNLRGVVLENGHRIEK